MPAQVQPGESISIKYDPAGSDLEGQEINAVAYVLEFGETPKAFDVAMAKSDNGYAGSFQTPANAQSVLVKFENGDGSKSDNNSDMGYHTMLYKDSKPVMNAHAATSAIYGNYARMLGVKANASKSKEHFDMEMGKHAPKNLAWIISPNMPQ